MYVFDVLFFSLSPYVSFPPHILTFTHWIAIYASINHHHVRTAILFQHIESRKKKNERTKKSDEEKRFVRFRQTTYYSSRFILKKLWETIALLRLSTYHIHIRASIDEMRWDEDVMRISFIICGTNGSEHCLSRWMTRREKKKKKKKRKEMRWDEKTGLFYISQVLRWISINGYLMYTSRSMRREWMSTSFHLSFFSSLQFNLSTHIVR